MYRENQTMEIEKSQMSTKDVTGFTKKDLFFCFITGLITGFSLWQITGFLKIRQFSGISYVWLMLVVPVVWVIGVNLGYFLGRWIRFFNQFGRYAAIGFTNAAVDFGVLNLLIYLTNISGGIQYTLFKGISFICAVIPSFFWNKYWAFNAGKTGKGGTEFLKFMSVMVIAIFVNDGAASLVVNYIHPLAGLGTAAWANIGAIAGSAVSLIFSFVGFKVTVFKVENKA